MIMKNIAKLIVIIIRIYSTINQHFLVQMTVSMGCQLGQKLFKHDSIVSAHSWTLLIYKSDILFINQTSYLNLYSCLPKSVQSCSGLVVLVSSSILVMCAFPELFVHLFTYTASATPEDVFDTFYVSDDTVLDEIILRQLKEFIRHSSENGLLIKPIYIFTLI